MPIEICGMIGTRSGSELDSPTGSLIGGYIDTDFIKRFARAHEESGFDRVLVGHSSAGPDGFTVTAFAASHTERLNFLVAHRPGFVAPTLAARKGATLDQVTGGRIAMHIITGGNDAEQQRDGDWLDHDARYRRTDEYLEVLRRTWTSPDPFDFDGEYYRFKRAFSEVRCFQEPHLPLYYGGVSGAALATGVKHADVYMFWGEPLASIREQIATVRGGAAAWGRTPRFSVSVRPILGATEGEAWEKAHSYLGRILELRKGSNNGHLPAYRPQAVGSQRLLSLADQGEVHDKRLWTAIAAAVGAAGNTTALVGTPEQVAESIVDYYDAGASTILIRGFEPLPDAIAYGEALVPLIREGVAARDRAQRMAPAGNA